MGGKEIEFEVERRREDRALSSVGKDEARRPSKAKKEKDNKKEAEEETAEEGTWAAYFEDPKTVDNMKFFVMAQSFVMFLTFGLPQAEVNKNPHMKKDLEDYKVQLAEEEKQKEQMMDLEEQARRIQDQLRELSKKHSSYKSLKYVQVEGLSVVKVGDDDSKESSPNQSN